MTRIREEEEEEEEDQGRISKIWAAEYHITE